MLKLKRDVGLFGATMYILGVIIGAGIYVIIGQAAGIVGPGLWLAFLIAAFIAACTGMSYAELSSTFPYDGAEYVYTERALKDRRFSFGIGWLKLATHIIGGAAVALGFGGYLAHLTGWNFILCALLLIFILTLINLFGVMQAVWFDIIMVMVAMIGLVLLIGAGIPSLQPISFYLEFPTGFSGVLTGAALVFFAFLGFENIGNLGEEVRNPKRILPKALIISVIVSTVLYVATAFIAVSVVPWQELGTSTSPLSDVMSALLGTKAGIMMAVMALAATGSTVLGLLIGTSRMIYGMAEEHSLPGFFMKVSSKRRVPYVAIIFTAVAIAVFVVPGELTSIAFLTDFGALFLFMVVNLCLIVLRYSHDHIPRGFRVPLNIGRFPVISAVGLVSCLGLLFHFEKKVFFAGIVLFVAGLMIYHVVAGKGKPKAGHALHSHARTPAPEHQHHRSDLFSAHAKKRKVAKPAKKKTAKSAKRRITKSIKKRPSRTKKRKVAKPTKKRMSDSRRARSKTKSKKRTTKSVSRYKSKKSKKPKRR